MTINFGGLASGLDTNAIIDGLVAAEKIPMTAIQTKQKLVDSAKDAVSSIASKIGTLKTAAAALATPSGFASAKATSSDASLVATANGAALSGSFEITVQSLAKEFRGMSAAQSSSTAALGSAGSLDIAIGGGAALGIPISADDSLSSIASKISSSGARVSAAVVFDGASYRLQVRGLDTGNGAAVAMTENGFSLGLSDPANVGQQAADARFTVDGLAMTRSTNQVAGAISGVTFAITKPTTGPVTLTVAPDSEGLTKKLQTFVSAYNDVVSTAHTVAGFGSAKATQAELVGDSSIRSVLDRLSKTAGAPVAGTTGRYTSLAAVGITTDKNGLLQLGASKLSDALAKDPSAVARLFVQDATTGSTGAMQGFVQLADRLATGTKSTLTTRAEALAATSRRLGDDADSLQRHVDLVEAQLRDRFTQLELVMSRYQSQTSSLNASLSALSVSA